MAPVGEEYLRGAVYPGGAPEQVVPLRGDVVQQPRPGSLQREGAAWELGIAVVRGKYNIDIDIFGHFNIAISNS